MIVCVPSKGDGGLASPIHEHFGSAPYFTLVNTENQEVQVIENKNEHHSHGTCHPMTQLNRYKIDVVICNGMGRRAVEALNYEGIKTLLTKAGSVEGALTQMNEGIAVDIDPARACHGHGQHQHVDLHHEHEHHEDHEREPNRKTIDLSGVGRGLGTGRGTSIGPGQGRGLGMGRGQGRSRGTGRFNGRGLGRTRGRGRGPGICR